jgi:bifunctional NMN adenylyltransferase/nudix hydrolase
MVESKKQFGAIIARFQVPTLHDGHVYLINQVYERCEEVLILLGVSEKIDSVDPLPFHMRRRMIQRDYPSAIILPLFDHPTHSAWSREVDSILNQFPGIEIYHSRHSFKADYQGKHNCVEIKELGDFSGTAIRNSILPKDTEDFRAGLIYGIKLIENANSPRTTDRLL